MFAAIWLIFKITIVTAFTVWCVRFVLMKLGLWEGAVKGVLRLLSWIGL